MKTGNLQSAIPNSTHEGTLRITEDSEIQCAVLEDGTRVLTMSAVYKALGRSVRSSIKVGNRVSSMPSFLDANNLQRFVKPELIEVVTPIAYRNLNGKVKEGYDARILPLVCDVYLEARVAGVLTLKQVPVAKQAEILVRSLSKIGIIALVDEATGYQYKREMDELQKILKHYISEEFLPWQQRFPDIFYKEIFRLNGWDFSVTGIKQRPSVIGKWTNQLIYNQLPPGVLLELKRRTPKTSGNNYAQRFHQSLTPDVGQVHLQNQINAIITLFHVSDDWRHFMSQFEKLVHRQSGQLELPLLNR